MFDDFEAHLHRLDIRYRSCQMDFFKHLQNKNISFLRHHIHDFLSFISWIRGTRHSFGFSRQEAERICPQFPIFRFPDKRHRLYRGFFHTFLIFGRKSNTDVCEHKNSDPDQKSCQLKPFFCFSWAPKLYQDFFVSSRSRKFKIWFESFSDIGDFTCDAPAIGFEGYERIWSKDIWLDSNLCNRPPLGKLSKTF